MDKKVRLAYLVSHPIQYQAPLLKKLSKQIDLTVFFEKNYSTKAHVDPGFGQKIKWDVPLLEGYRYQFLSGKFNNSLTDAIKKREIDVLWLHGYSSVQYLYTIWLAKKNGIKVLVRGESNLICNKEDGLKHYFRAFLLKFLDRFVDGYLTIGSDNREFYQHYGVKEKKLFFMPYVVDNDFFKEKVKSARVDRESFKKELGIREDWPVILYASKLMQRKHIDDLLDAYIALSEDGVTPPKAYLLIVGDGELKEKVLSKLKVRSWDTLLFLGFQNQTKLPAFYDLADIFVLPSEKEPWGLVVNEAMNAKTAILTTNEVGAARDLVKENGKVISPSNVHALKDALKEMLSDKTALEKMKEKSLEIIHHWSFDLAIEELLNAIEAVL